MIRGLLWQVCRICGERAVSLTDMFVLNGLDFACQLTPLAATIHVPVTPLHPTPSARERLKVETVLDSGPPPEVES